MASHGANAPSATQPTSPNSSWTEPPWSGWIETTGDALIILEAARRGLIPRVTRRLVDSERKMITSGSVFVFDEDESGIKRWTDGFFWSPSRILGNFLLYRETDKRGAGHRGARSDTQESSSNSLLVSEHNQYGQDGTKNEQQSLSRPKGELGSLGIDKQRERSLVGSLTNSYKFKPEGMMKKTFSLTIGGVSQHLISYYKIEDVEQGRLRTPSSLPELASLDISPEYLDKTHFRNPPKVDYDIDGVPRYRGEADEAEPSPRATISAPLSTGQPLLLDSRSNADGPGDGGAGKRLKRYDPYSSTGPKRTRKTKSAQHQHTSSGGGGADARSAAGSQHSQSPTISGPPPSGAMYGSPDMGSHSSYGQSYGVNYYNQYHIPPPSHVFGPGSGGAASGSAQGGTPPPPAASGIVSPAPGSSQLSFPGYSGPSGDGTPAPASGTSTQYTYYPPPPSAQGHYSPYGNVTWTPYTYATPQAGLSSSSAGAEGKGRDNAQSRPTVASEET